MTTLRVLFHVAAQRDYELDSLEFSNTLRRPVYGLCQVPREWHETLRTTLAALGFHPSSADPSLFVRSGPTPFFVLVYVDDLVFATLDRAALPEVHQRFGIQHSTTQPTPLAVDHRLTDLFPNEPFESSGPYVELASYTR
ncbi:unnamed protein product [Closterium sp. NIES-53]